MEPQQRVRWLKWVSVVILVADLLVCLGLRFLTGDHAAHKGPILYPLWLHFYSPDFPGTILVWALLGGLGILIVFFLNRGRKGNGRMLLILLMPLTAFLCGVSNRLITVFIKGSAPITALSSIQSGGSTYNLAADPCYKPDSVCPPTAYLVLKCDGLGLFCNLVDIHYSKGGARFEGYSGVGDSAALLVDAQDNSLYVQIAEEKFPIGSQTLP